MTTPEQQALELLNTHNEFGSPAYPVDPIAMARNLGIRTRYSDGLTNTEAGAYLYQNDNAYIVLNERFAPSRVRYTAALLLGHYFFEEAQAPGSPRPDVIHRVETCMRDASHNFCNKFALNLMIPVDVLESLKANTDAINLIELSMKLQVPHTVLANAKNLV